MKSLWSLVRLSPQPVLLARFYEDDILPFFLRSRQTFCAKATRRGWRLDQLMAADVASPAGSVSTRWNNEIYIHVYSYLAKMRRERERDYTTTPYTQGWETPLSLTPSPLFRTGAE